MSRLPVWRRGFPFFLAKPRSAVERLRAVTAKQVWKQGPMWRRLLLGGLMSIGWPAVTLVDAFRIRKKSTAPSDPGFARLYAAALTRNFPPNQYAHYASLPGFDPSQIPDILLPLDFRGLHELSRRRGASAEDIQDKARFEQVCRAHDLACVPNLATFKDGESTGETALRRWGDPFFIKALSGNRGVGAEQWRPGGRGFISSTGHDCTIDEIIEALGSSNSIVQPVLKDCAELRALGSVALSSLRVITAKGSSIPAASVAALLSLATQESALTSHGGTSCGIDVERGTVVKVRARSSGDDPTQIDDRDSELVGFALPWWSETIDLICKAHDEAFPAFVTLGWDVALTSSGPILLEANVSWNMAQHQVLTGPLGRTCLGDVIDELLGAPEGDRVLRSPAP